MDIIFGILIALAVTIGFGLFTAKLFNKMGIPEILAFILVGFIFSSRGLGLIIPELNFMTYLLDIDKLFAGANIDDVNNFGLVAVVLFMLLLFYKAGLDITIPKLKIMGLTGILMGFLPALIEGIFVSFISYFLVIPSILSYTGVVLDSASTIVASCMFGFIFAAATPGVILPVMNKLQKGGYGEKKQLPNLLIMGSSLDDIVSITLFITFTTIFLGIFGVEASGSTVSIIIEQVSLVSISIGTSIILALFNGFIIGKFLIPTLYTKTDKTKNFGLVLILFLVLLVSGGYLFFPTSEGLITIMFSGIATNLFLKDSNQANWIAPKLNFPMTISIPVVFAIAGSLIDIRLFSFKIIIIALFCIFMGLVGRAIGVHISMLSRKYNAKDRLFCSFSYLPKGTSQIGILFILLTTLASKGLLGVPYFIEVVNTATIFSSVAIIVTIPLGIKAAEMTQDKFIFNDERQ